mgnify:CR=1 FL=1
MQLLEVKLLDMKNLILFLIILTTFTNISYASFPIPIDLYSDTLQTEEIKLYHYSLLKIGIDLGSCKCISCRNGIDPIVVKPKPLPIVVKPKYLQIKSENVILKNNREISSVLYVLLSILSAIGAFLFGILSLGHAFSASGSYSAVLLFFALSFISVIGSVILALKARKKGVKWGVAMLGIGVAVLVVLFLFPLFFV